MHGLCCHCSPLAVGPLLKSLYYSFWLRTVLLAVVASLALFGRPWGVFFPWVVTMYLLWLALPAITIDF